MACRLHAPRSWLGPSALVVGLVVGSNALASDDEVKQRCVEAHIAAQRAQNVGHLVEAKGHLLACARTDCPGVLREECLAWLPEVLSALPVVTVGVEQEGGGPVTLDKLWIDGTAVLAPSVGLAIELDPGRHVLRGRADTGAMTELMIELAPGEVERSVVLVFPKPKAEAPRVPAPTVVAEEQTPPPRPPEPAQKRAESPWVYGLLGLGALSGASFGYFAISGKSKQADLETNCAPSCSEDEVSRMRRDYLVADVSLLVGLGAVAGAVLVHYELADSSASLEVGPASAYVSGRF